jgi:hypothetical protein
MSTFQDDRQFDLCAIHYDTGDVQYKNASGGQARAALDPAARSSFSMKRE